MAPPIITLLYDLVNGWFVEAELKIRPFQAWWIFLHRSFFRGVKAGYDQISIGSDGGAVDALAGTGDIANSVGDALSFIPHYFYAEGRSWCQLYLPLTRLISCLIYPASGRSGQSIRVAITDGRRLPRR